MRLHFIAIGGSIMHSLALALHQRGHEITGSDDEIFDPARSKLSSAGLLPMHTGWDSLRIHKNLDFVILGMHAKANNPELLRAIELGIPVLSFPEFVFNQTKRKQRIVVAGSHGKTTITSMIMHAFKALDISFDWLVGSGIDGFEQQVSLLDDSKYAVIEGDEYLTSALDPMPKFLHYRPDFAIITGIAWDHYNVYPAFENYLRQFRLFIESMPAHAVLVYNGADTYLPELVTNYGKHLQCLPYYCLPYNIDSGKTSIQLEGRNFNLNVFGRHNVENISAVLRLCKAMGLIEVDILETLTNFSGAGRRLELMAESEDTKVYFDFAHAPSKVQATVRAVKETFPDKKLITCLELHTYSSLNKTFIPQYKGSLDQSDIPIVYYNPHTLALKKLELDESTIARGFMKEDLQIFSDSELLKKYLFSLDFNQSVLLLMSSGNFNGLDLIELAKFAST